MKTILLTSASVLFLGFVTFMKEVSGNDNKSGKELIEKKGITYEGYFPDFLLRGTSDLSKDLHYEVRGIYARSVKKELLSKAKTLYDIIPNYPHNWISSYTTVEISATCNGQFLIAKGKNDTLNIEQQKLLSAIDIGSDLIINVNYTYRVPVMDVVENNTMHVLMTVIPETQAEFLGGYEQLMKYFKENTADHFSQVDPANFPQVVIKFTVNEGGEIVNVKVARASGDKNIDYILLGLIKKMPKWKPAESSTGVKVKQDFELVVGKRNEGC